MNRSPFVLILLACLVLATAVPMVSGAWPSGARQAARAQTDDGYVYAFDWYGDTYVQTNGVSDTWSNEPMTTNWFANDSLGFCWNYAVQPGLRTEAAEIYLRSSVNTTLWLDWLQDSCDDVTVLLWNFVTATWTEFWHSDNCDKDRWIEQSFALTAAYSNGSVLVRWELAKVCVGNTGNWIPSLYIDFATLYDSTDPPPISPLDIALDIVIVTTEGGRAQVGRPASVNWSVNYDGEVRIFCDGLNVANATPIMDTNWTNYTGGYGMVAHTFVPDEIRIYKFWLCLDIAGHPLIAGYQELIGDNISVVWYHSSTTRPWPITDIDPIRTMLSIAFLGVGIIVIGVIFTEKREL